MPHQTPMDGFQETKEHGSELFRFNIYPCSIPKDFPSVPLHWHRNMELIYIKKGSGRIQFGLETRQADAGDIFVLPPESLHALFGLPGRVMEYENIIFDVNLLGGGTTDICDKEYLVPLLSGRLLAPACLTPADPLYAQITACLTDAEQLCARRDRGYELGVKASMLRLLYLLTSMTPKPPEPESPDTERLKRVVSEVENRYAERLSVPDAAALCGYSTSHFMRWFREMTGTTFTAYLIGRRLALAAQQLSDTDDKIVTIAQNAGYDNLTNFNRQFKARYRQTPKEYRASSRGIQAT